MPFVQRNAVQQGIRGQPFGLFALRPPRTHRRRRPSGATDGPRLRTVARAARQGRPAQVPRHQEVCRPAQGRARGKPAPRCADQCGRPDRRQQVRGGRAGLRLHGRVDGLSSG